MVETGVKVHRAIQRSSSLGKTILISLVLSLWSCCNSVTFTSAAQSGHHSKKSLKTVDVYIFQSCALCPLLMFIIPHQAVNKGRRGVFNRTHALKKWHWGMGLAVGGFCSSPSSLSPHPYNAVLIFCPGFSLFLRVPQPAKYFSPNTLSRIGNKTIRQYWQYPFLWH